MSDSEYNPRSRHPLVTMLGSHVFLLMLCCTMALPFLWMVLASLKPFTEVESVNWVP